MLIEPCETCKGLNRCDSIIRSACPAYQHYADHTAERVSEEKRVRADKERKARREHMGWMERHCRWRVDDANTN